MIKSSNSISTDSRPNTQGGGLGQRFMSEYKLELGSDKNMLIEDPGSSSGQLRDS